MNLLTGMHQKCWQNIFSDEANEKTLQKNRFENKIKAVFILPYLK